MRSIRTASGLRCRASEVVLPAPSPDADALEPLLGQGAQDRRRDALVKRLGEMDVAVPIGAVLRRGPKGEGGQGQLPWRACATCGSSELAP